jgi:hypothetical protein
LRYVKDGGLTQEGVSSLISDVPREALLEAVEEFDTELRDTEEWVGWEQKGTYKYAIVHEGHSTG